MAKPNEEASIEEQIARLCRQYEEAIRRGDEFRVLKQIRQQLNGLMQPGDKAKAETKSHAEDS